ncbi:aminotransferase class III-fold pyridoxal phosphate-dependent enzyme [Nesterenkonia sedimenti]|uniref:aminotransferase class III-fold pyridoxal phosphate-dependent enzyme n=1 Tax=Nesterenkonia sedimenti TaxID=1463632 RepID=UPI00389954AA
MSYRQRLHAPRVIAVPGFFKQIVHWWRENGVVFIADEVQTGFARTGRWFTETRSRRPMSRRPCPRTP